MKWKQYIVAAAIASSSVLLVQAEANPYGVVAPPDWEYQAIMTLVKHGAITNTHGLDLGNRSFTRWELIPLMADVVERRETMNESDRLLALRLYHENRRSIMNYMIEQEEGKKGPSTEDSIYLDKDMDIKNPTEKALTPEEIQNKMETFTIDDRAVAIRGDVRIRMGQGGGDMRSRLEMTIPMGKGANAVPVLGPVDEEVLEAQEGNQWAVSKKEQRPMMKVAKQSWQAQQKAERQHAKAEKREAQSIAKAEREALKRAAKEEKARVKAEAKAKKDAEKEARRQAAKAKKEARQAEKAASGS